MLVTPPLGPPVASRVANPSPPAAAPSIGDRIETGVAKVVGFGVGVAGALFGGLTNGCMGAAEGLVKGFGVRPEHAEGVRTVVFAAGMMAAGTALMGPVGSVIFLAGGALLWKSQSEAEKARVINGVDEWVGRYVPCPEEDDRHVLERTIDAGGGTLIGAFEGMNDGVRMQYEPWKSCGEALVHTVAGWIR